ncbi:MAG: phosphoglucomutase, alpha-D-glucose phosphate-specific [Nitrospinota bacterium]
MGLNIDSDSSKKDLAVNIPELVSSYYLNKDKFNPVTFGTSGHRGSSFSYTFNESHIVAICQAIADYRAKNQLAGPLFIGIDTHALSKPAFITAVETLTANKISICYQADGGYTPTPAISYAILEHNKNNKDNLADGIVITPSHNPPEDGGLKYNYTNGGPANESITGYIEEHANRYLENNLRGVKRIPFSKAISSSYMLAYDFVGNYVDNLDSIIDMDIIRNSKIKLGVDPLGGSGISFYERIIEQYKIDLTIVNRRIDPTFSFMPLDTDGKIRMDCSSSKAMANLIQMKDKFDLAFGNDPDFDRHGIVTPTHGLLNPNHYLSTAIWYLFQSRKNWTNAQTVGKTVVSSSMIDKVVKSLGLSLYETPVGFKWFVDKLFTGSIGIGAEESSGASFLRKDQTSWSTDKDGIILNLLAAEMSAKLEQNPGMIYEKLEDQFGKFYYARIDKSATSKEKKLLKNISVDDINIESVANDLVLEKLTSTPSNNQPIGGIKVITKNGWFAARPSGTEESYKIYAESFIGHAHLELIQDDASKIVHSIFESNQ